MKAEPVTPELLARVLSAMQADGHNVPEPTHAILGADGSLYGAFSAAYAPCLFFWMDSRKGQGIASFRGLRLAWAELRARGHSRILLPIEAKSPFYPWVEAIGFTPMGACELFQFNAPAKPPCARSDQPSSSTT